MNSQNRYTEGRPTSFEFLCQEVCSNFILSAAMCDATLQSAPTTSSTIIVTNNIARLDSTSAYRIRTKLKENTCSSSSSTTIPMELCQLINQLPHCVLSTSAQLVSLFEMEFIIATSHRYCYLHSSVSFGSWALCGIDTHKMKTNDTHTWSNVCWTFEHFYIEIRFTPISFQRKLGNSDTNFSTGKRIAWNYVAPRTVNPVHSWKNSRYPTKNHRKNHGPKLSVSQWNIFHAVSSSSEDLLQAKRCI